MTLPWLAWLLGYADVESIILGVFVSFCVVSFILASFMLSMHLRTTLRYSMRIFSIKIIQFSLKRCINLLCLIVAVQVMR